jgi:hypothetical protein
VTLLSAGGFAPLGQPTLPSKTAELGTSPQIRHFSMPPRRDRLERGSLLSYWPHGITRLSTLAIQQYQAMKAQLPLPLRMSACWFSSIQGPQYLGLVVPTIPRSIRHCLDH